MRSGARRNRTAYSGRTHQRRWLWWWIGGFVLLVAAVTGMIYLILHASFLRVREVTVQGTRVISPAAVAAAVERSLLAGPRWHAWLGPDNLLVWKLGLPSGPNSGLPFGVAKVAVSSSLADRTVRIEVSERETEGIWCVAVEECHTFDDQGILFAQAPSASGILILKVTDEAREPRSLGQAILSNPDWVQNLFTTLSILRSRGVEVVSVSVRDRSLREWEVRTASGITFFFSLTFVPENLSTVIDDLRARLPLSNLVYLDFRVPNRVYYR